MMPAHVEDAVKRFKEQSAIYAPHYDTAESLGILLDDDLALCTPETFQALGEYSLTLPSGKYEGKVWRRVIVEDGEEKHVLGQYSLDPNPEEFWPDIVRITWRTLEVVA